MPYIKNIHIEKVNTTAKLIIDLTRDIRKESDSKTENLFQNSRVGEDFLWGSKYHIPDNLEFVDYETHIRGILFSFLLDNFYANDLSVDLDKLFSEIDNHGDPAVRRSRSLNVERVVDSPELGMYDVENDKIWMKFIPEPKVEKLESKLRSQLGESKVDSILRKFPGHYNSINSISQEKRT